MGRPYALLRAGFPYFTTLGMRRMTNFPVDVVIGDERRMYTLCRGEGLAEIRRFNWDDEDLGTIGSPGAGDGQFTWPACMIRDRQENLYVSDEALHRISAFSRDGKFLGKWGAFGSGDGELNRPSGIAFDAEENMYVVDTLNHRIQKFTREGKFLLKFGSFGAGEGEFNMPWGVTVDDEGSVYVADWRNDRIQKFTADGVFIMKFGKSGSGDGEFNRPAGVAVDKDGDIYVADWGNNRVQQFNAEGRYLDKFIGDATMGKAARTYVLANAKPLRLREMAYLEEQKRLRGPASVRVDNEGRLYIADYGCHRVQIYKKEAYPLGPDEIAPPLRNPTLQTT
jgi:DNA-binding beta-propeller fold protein YncE